jgi:hypothetical protein
VGAKSRLGEMIYWWALGIGAILVFGGIIAAFDRREVEPVLITGVFALGAWLVGRAARDLLGDRQGGT